MENGDEEMPVEGMNIGSIISEKLKDSIQEMDLVGVLQKMVAATPENEEALDVRNKLRGVLEQFRQMTAEEKAVFTAKVKEGLSNKISMRLKENPAFSGIEDAIREAVMSKLYMVAAGIVLILILLVFFGYKLYKSIKEKEKKREEKKKAKQMKKKK